MMMGDFDGGGMQGVHEVREWKHGDARNVDGNRMLCQGIDVVALLFKCAVIRHDRSIRGLEEVGLPIERRVRIARIRRHMAARSGHLLNSHHVRLMVNWSVNRPPSGGFGYEFHTR